jgi:hypothetical protein
MNVKSRREALKTSFDGFLFGSGLSFVPDENHGKSQGHLYDKNITLKMDRERDTLSKKVKGLVNKQSLDKFPTIYLSINRIYALEKQSEQKNGLYEIKEWTLWNKTAIGTKYFSKSIFPGGNLIM